MRGIVLVLGCSMLAPTAFAHRLAPSSLELREVEAGRVTAVWRSPRLAASDALPWPVLPAHCRPVGSWRTSAEDVASVSQVELVCNAGGLVGAELAVNGLDRSGTDALVRVVLLDGREIRAVLTAAAPRVLVPVREDTAAVIAAHARLGAEHLAGGLDHLLFVTGLVCLLSGWRALVGAVSAFTAGHAVTLALAAGTGARLPTGPVEVAIAGTLVLLALEAARAEPALSPLVRRPALLPFGFGLVHGLGFAGALAEIGLPQHAIPLALFSFNLGIEAVQLAAVAVVLPIAVALRWARPRLPVVLGELPATAVGSLGVCLALERAVIWLGGA